MEQRSEVETIVRDIKRKTRKRKRKRYNKELIIDNIELSKWIKLREY